MSDDDELEQDILLELQEKDEQLRLAAELGQSLLRRTEELQTHNEQLLAQSQLANEAVEETEWRVQELTGESARLHSLVEDKELELEQKELELREALEAGASVSASAIGRAIDAVADAAPPRTAQAQTELDRLRDEVEELRERQAEVQHGWEEEGDGRRAAERKAKDVAKQLLATQQELQERSEEAAANERAAKEEQAAARKERDRAAELQVRLASMEQQVEQAATEAAVAFGTAAERMQRIETADSKHAEWLSRLKICCVRLPLDDSVDLDALASTLEQAEARDELTGDAEALCRNLCTRATMHKMKERRKFVGTADFVAALETLKR